MHRPTLDYASKSWLGDSASGEIPNALLSAIVAGSIALVCAAPMFAKVGNEIALLGIVVGAVLSVVGTTTSVCGLLANRTLRGGYVATLLLNGLALSVNGFYAVAIIVYFSSPGC